MNFPDGLGEKAIKDVVQEHPVIGEILERYEIGCITCGVGICLLKVKPRPPAQNCFGALFTLLSGQAGRMLHARGKEFPGARDRQSKGGR